MGEGRPLADGLDETSNMIFSPGQWLDTFIPGLPKAGGFTITSTPSEARPSSQIPPFLELAVQNSNNPPAKWFSRPQEEILGKQLVVRVGGSFTWPPPTLDAAKIDRLVLIAGGVGINPLISIFSHLIRTGRYPKEVHFVYATKTTSELDPHSILFLTRLMDLVGIASDPGITLSLYLTGTGEDGMLDDGRLPNRTFARRITELDLVRALDGFKENIYGAEHDRQGTVCYVCGPQKMTDEFVGFLGQQPGMAKERVLCEKWW
ncbi:hypothetical protein B0A50_01463 [Salinomyces thailandicus]|uniref:Ferric reductase NAD binding domain-containing protein n=1 Tax=Salinomyces thailandicus TaxID=706561 RepID=A0A4U0UB11_9PEZI|nr:hypothetical protein B0A50_01463 [Salinomyces thailandica]